MEEGGEKDRQRDRETDWERDLTTSFGTQHPAILETCSTLELSVTKASKQLFYSSS